MDYSLKEDAIEYFFGKVKGFILPSKDNNYKSKFLQSNILFYCVILLLTFKIATVLISTNFPNNIFFADITKSALENFANQTRQSLGLCPLVENEKLNRAAQLKAENMIQNQYFSHTSPTGVTPWFWFIKAGYKYKYAGENLAVGFYGSEEVYNAWLNSPSHKANIVNANYTEVGTAVLKGFGQDNTIVVVQEFGSQLPNKQAVVQPKTNLTPKTSEPAQANTQMSTTNTQTTVNTNTNEKVLSQTTGPQNYIESPKGNSIGNSSSKFLSYVIYNYDGLIQNIIYGTSLIVIGALLTLIFFNFKINFKKELVFRAVFLMALLSVAALINKEIIISLIPHQVII